MKHKLRFLNFLFYKGRKIIITLLFFSATVPAQQQTPQEFPIGSTFGYEHRTNQTYHQIYDQTGFNRIEQDARQSTSQFLTDYNLGAVNMKGINDYVYHYSSSYYSKWEAEVDTVAPYIGAKHKFGKWARWKDTDTLCWSTEEMTEAGDSLVYGPHYHQEKWYRRWLYDDPNMSDKYDVRFITRYNMALVINDPSLQPNEEICRITVIVRHAPVINGHWDGETVVDDTLKETKTLYASDFQPYGQFKPIYFSNVLSERWYKYPPEFQSPLDDKLNYPAPPCTVWVDNNGNNGVEFRLEWLGNTKCDLYIDNIEVYDDFGWKDYIEEPFITTQNIIQYAEQYADSFSTWNINLANWMGCDEPSSIDSYIPLRIVDSLLKDIGAPRLMVHFYPQWYITVNSDSQLVRYYKMAQPDILNIHFFPFNSWNPTPTFGDWEAYRKQLQISATLTGEKGFWYKAQNFGYWSDNGYWSGYRQPTPDEHNAEIMLALAHGIKGLIFSHFDSFRSYDDINNQWYTLMGFIGTESTNYDTTALWYLVRDNIVPRLKGKLGKTLMSLDYTGDFLQLQHVYNQQNPNNVTYDYLTLELVGSTGDHN
ncbi:MAG: hypothetical protein OQJ78_06085 [Ignavibacteriaceae bacterium]|nr:hypothetical protein [Ignavibacteriaceae bacterium]